MSEPKCHINWHESYTIEPKQAEETPSAWYNYHTQTYEWLVGLPPEGRIAEFLPQNDAAIGLYQVDRELGKTQAEAMKDVYESYLGKHQEK